MQPEAFDWIAAVRPVAGAGAVVPSSLAAADPLADALFGGYGCGAAATEVLDAAGALTRQAEELHGAISHFIREVKAA